MILYMSSEEVTDTTEVQMLGRVKWFNNKAGYGFITVTDTGKDIFVHHSGINVGHEQYRYLVQGEYVQFYLDKTPGGTHSVQAKNVCGINNGMLMCETRRDLKQSRFSYKSEEDVPSERPKSMKPPRDGAPQKRGAGPRADNGWSLAKK